MENRSFIQLSFNTDGQYNKRFMIIAEVVNEEVQHVHLVPVPSWLVFYSEEYRFYCINLN
jgi:hypothetical protein